MSTKANASLDLQLENAVVRPREPRCEFLDTATREVWQADGWRLIEIPLTEEWIVALPAPTETYWFKGALSFQGPSEIPSSAVVAN